MSAAPKLQIENLYHLEITKGPHIGTTASFGKGSIFIGRGPENDLVLSADPRASRQHAEIKQQGNEFVIINLSQKNFILVNGKNVQSEVLHKDTMIEIGDTQMRFEPENASPAAAVNSSAAPTPVSSLRMEALKPLPFSPSTPGPLSSATPAMPKPAAPAASAPSTPSRSIPAAPPRPPPRRHSCNARCSE